ncbi:aldehyde dehydrogenase family protein [Elongatibacter sediminis]|uniref:Aldehyde dehydrogenase family protein n=1 Tax=Elongatibacter sediminis TaxID=3119006 RepID=A0AAW9RJI4_9GAMM
MTDYHNFIDGAWIDSDQRNQNINPSDTDDVIGAYAQADSNQTESAIEAASRAFESWSTGGIQQRADALDVVGSEILARKDELGRLLAREEGKILPEATGEVVRAGQIFKFFSGEALRAGGDLIPSVRPGIQVEVTREPVGVVGIITPWNFPIAIPAWKIAPALAFGNTVVFKPASNAPGSAWALAEIISRAGFPDGVFNLVMGAGSVVGSALLNDGRVNGVSFTGSVATGQRVATDCSRRGAKFQLEMGGKNPLVVLDDADLDTAVECAVNSAYYSTGQRCTASSRFIVTPGIRDEFVAACVERLQGIRVGHALGEGVQIGPLVDQQQLQQSLDYIEIGRAEGAKLVTGGERVSCDTPGFYLSPALFTGTSNEMRINQEEIFGPVASVIDVANLDEAISVANDTEFGLSAGICTRSLGAATRFKRESRAGMVMVNLPTAGVDYHVPFGGIKNSSYGPREQGRYAAEFYTQVKTAYIQPA